MPDNSELAEKKFNLRYENAEINIVELFNKLYQNHPDAQTGFKNLLKIINNAFEKRSDILKNKDLSKQLNEEEPWFLNNNLCGMSLYIDRFCGTINNLQKKLDYFETLGINLLHLMPVFESPKNESDGGYAVSDFRKIDKKYGTLKNINELEKEMKQKGMYLMLDIVLNHTSNQHAWALKAKLGEKNIRIIFIFLMIELYLMNLKKRCRKSFLKMLPEILLT